MDVRAEFEAQALPLADALYRTAVRMTGAPASAEDLVQDAYLKAFRAFGRFEKGTNFKAWIFTILTNTFINEYRRKSAAPTDFTEAEPEGEVEAVHLKAEDVDRLGDHLGDEAARALAKVPPEFRLPFLLSTFEDLSYKEIAGVLGIPIGTVMSRLFRARRILREELAAAGARA
ncbi:MAG TPA: sigma-70 family RNA polymerase sigma factor [Planctomycetota bacterium]